MFGSASDERHLFLFLAAAVVVSGSDAVHADLAATQYVGHGIMPVDALGIRMVSAKVDIDWGEPGTLSAVFVMNNEDAEASDVQVGFPVSLPAMFRNKKRLDFTMTFDGVPIDRASIRQDTPDKDQYDLPSSTIWFHCRHRFPPGATTVKVETRLPATAAYHSPHREDLFYCVQTGAAWKGTIGSEEIAIHFPRTLLPGEIIRCEPASGTVEGNTVRWRFENFKPKDRDHDIWLRFLNPDVLPILDDLRRQSAEDPGNLRKKFDLIKHLYALTPTRFSFPQPPEEMPKDEYQELLGMLRSDKDRARFDALYVQGPDGKYRQKNSDWTQDADEITSLLSAVDYVPRDDRSAFLTEGRTLMAQLLREHPHDADAWNLYLLQSIGYPGELPIYSFQLDRIKAALRNCPDDPLIRLWDTCGRLERRRQSVRSSAPTILDRRAFAKERQLRDLLEKRGVLNSRESFTVRYSHRSDDYYF